jgi:hypothetical protein
VTTQWSWALSPKRTEKSIDEDTALQVRDELLDASKEHHPMVPQTTSVLVKRVDNLPADNCSQLDRLMDLYLSGAFAEALSDRNVRLGKTIRALEEERVGLLEHLEKVLLTAGQVQGIQELAAEVGRSLETIEVDFEAKRRLIEALDAWVTLTVENGEKVVYARCTIEPDVSKLRLPPFVI